MRSLNVEESASSTLASVELADSSTFRDLTEKLGIRRKVTFAVNGEHDLDESHMLEDGDEVLVFTSVSGG